MIRSLSIVLFSTFLAAGTAMACPSGQFKSGTVVANADGIITRTVQVKRASDSQNANAEVTYVPVVRDRIQMEVGDVISLNTLPNAVDVLKEIEIRVKSQDRDEGGVLATTYFVKETTTSMFGGVTQKGVEEFSLVKVTSNYLGNGTYAKGCGNVKKMEVETTASNAAAL